MKKFIVLRRFALMVIALFAFNNLANAQGCTISTNSTKLCLGAIVEFEIPVAAYTSILWEFGDGGTSVIPNKVTYTYTSRGNYQVKVTTWDQFGNRMCWDSIQLVVYARPDAKLILPDSNVQCYRDNWFCYKDNSTKGADSAIIQQWIWDFGDGDSSNLPNPCKEYFQSGTFDVGITVIDENGCFDTTWAIARIRVLPKLAPKFKTVYTITCPATPVLFVNQTDSVGKDLVGWYWDFNNGKSDSSMTNWTNFVDTYYVDGAFNPKFTIVSKFGCIDSFVGYAAARNIYYEFDIKSSVNGLPTCWSGNNICYTQKRRPFAYYWLWNFDDPPTGPNNFNDVDWTACHTYSSTGFYAITLDIWEPNCHRDTTYCEYAQLKGPRTMIKLPPPPAFPLNNCREGDIIPLEVFNRYASWCLNPGRDTIFYATRQYIGPYLASVDRFYCNADTFRIDTVFDECISSGGDTFKIVTQINWHMLAFDPSKAIYHYDSIQEITVGKEWYPPNFTSASSPVTPPAGLSYYPQSGTCTPQTMHDTDEFIPNCQGPNYVRFTNNSIKFRLYYAMDDNPTSYTFPRDDVSQDICVNKSYPWASDSMQHFWNFGDGDQCTSTVQIPNLKCMYSTEAAPWHLFEETGCFTVSLEELDTVMQCSNTATMQIVMEPPDAGFEFELVDSFNMDKSHLPIDTLDWQTQAMVNGLSKRLNLRRGMILNGTPCVDYYPQRWDLSETMPSCSRQTYWMLFDSAIDCDTAPCIDVTYMDLDNDGIAEKHTNSIKACNWIPQAILEMFLLPYYYPPCDESPPPPPNEPPDPTKRGARCPCKTVGLIIQTGECFDTFFYHDYKYIYNLDPTFDVVTWRDYMPAKPDAREALNYGANNIGVDKNNDGMPDYVILNTEHFNLCPDYKLMVTPYFKNQSVLDSFYFVTERFFMAPWVSDIQPIFSIRKDCEDVRDTFYLFCHKDSFNIDIFTGDTNWTECFIFPDATQNCGPELWDANTDMQIFINQGYLNRDTFTVLALTDTLDIMDTAAGHRNQSLWLPGKYRVTATTWSVPTDPLYPDNRCGNARARELYVGHWTEFWADDQIVCYEGGGDTVTFRGRARYFKTWYPFDPTDTLDVPFWEDPIGHRGGSIGPPAVAERWEYDFGMGDGWMSYDSLVNANTLTDLELVQYIYDKPGNYTVKMRTWDSNGCPIITEKKDFIKVIGTVADFELKQQLGICAPQKADFRNLSYGLNEWQYTYDQYGQVIDSVRKDSIIGQTWYFGDSSSLQRNTSVIFEPIHTYKSNGKYDAALIVYNTNGCTDTVIMKDFITISGPKGTFDLVGAYDHCLDSAEFYFKVNSQEANKWAFRDDTNAFTFFYRESDSIFTLDYTKSKPGIYYVRLQVIDSAMFNPYTGRDTTCGAYILDDKGDTFEIKIEVLPMNPSGFEGDTILCSEGVAAFKDLSDAEFTDIFWDFGDGSAIEQLSPGDSTVHTYTLNLGVWDTNFYVKIDAQGARCGLNPDSLNVRVVQVEPEFNEVDVVMPIYHFENKTLGGYYYAWDFGGGDPSSWNTDKMDNATTNYGNVQDSFEVCLTSKVILQGIDAQGCAKTKCKMVINRFDTGLVVPNVFTPGDINSLNDVFQLRMKQDDTGPTALGAIGVEKFEILIYNRWGEKVFESTKLIMSSDGFSQTVGESWDGTRMNKGNDCPAGAYFWVVNYQLRGGVPVQQSGTVTLIR